MTAPLPSPGDRLPSGRLLRVGVVLFALGVVAVVVDVVPFFFGHGDRPVWLNLACLLLPLGLVLAVGAALARGRADQRRALADVERARRRD